MKSLPTHADAEALLALLDDIRARGPEEFLVRVGLAREELSRILRSRRNAIAMAHRLREARDHNRFRALEQHHLREPDPFD